MTDPVVTPKYVLVLPHCPFDWDRPAAYQVTTIWGVTASLCSEHANVYRRNGSPVRRLLLGAAREPLPTEAEVGRYIDRQDFRSAAERFRGQRQAPHQYVTIQRSDDPWMQLRVLAFIRVAGERHRRFGKWHTYWRREGYEYWDLDPTQTILNRRELTGE